MIHLILLASTSWAGTKSITVHGNIPVYETPSPGANTLFYAVEGEELLLDDQVKAGFRKARSPGDPQARGFVKESDVRRSERRGPPLGKWGFGGGLAYQSLSQKRDTFSTEDQVTYKPSEFKSTATGPFLTVQRKRRDFWRLTVAQKSVNYEGTATTDVSGEKPKTVDLSYNFLSVAYQLAWNPWRKAPVYFGLEFEAAKALSVELKLNSVTQPTDETSKPYYFGLQAVAGVQLYTKRSWAAFAEARYGGVVNQSPVIRQINLSLGVLFWP